MSSYTFCWYDTQTKKANAIEVRAKTRDQAIIEFAERLEEIHGDEVAGLCAFDAELAYQWIKDNFPHYEGWNIITEQGLHRQEIVFEVSSRSCEQCQSGVPCANPDIEITNKKD